MEQAGDNKRRVTALERYFYRRPNPNVIMIGRFKGYIKENEFRKALNRVEEIHPLLGARVQQNKDGEAHFHLDSNVQLQVVERDAGKADLLEQAKRELKLIQPSGPLFRIVLYLGDDNFDILVNGHHMACDGLSLYKLLRDIYLHLGEPGRPVEVDRPVIVGDCLPDSVGLRGYHRRIINRLNRKWAKKEILFGDQELLSLHRAYWEQERGLDIMHWKMSLEGTSKLIEKSREHDVTVHSTLAAAFLLAQLEVQGKERYLRNISMPVSIRNRLTEPARESVGLYYSSFKLEFKPLKDQDFWESARAVHDHIRDNIDDRNIFTILMQLKELHPTLVDSITFTRYGLLDDPLAIKFLKLEGGYTDDTGLDLSNIGKLEMPETVGEIEFSEFLGPSVYNEFQQKYLGVLTANGQMSFTMTFCRSRVSWEIVEGIRDRAMAELERAIQ